jgi:AraC-like DNA-binding protein
MVDPKRTIFELFCAPHSRRLKLRRVGSWCNGDISTAISNATLLRKAASQPICITATVSLSMLSRQNDPLHRRLRQLRSVRCRFDCYRVERTSSRAGVSPAEVQRLSRRTVTTAIQTKAHYALGGIRGTWLQQRACPTSASEFGRFSEARAFANGLRNSPAPLSGDVLNRGLMRKRV